jgi:hypothetical protein
MKGLDRIVIGLVVVAAVASTLVASLPRLLPTLAVLYVFAVIGRLVWWYTR